MLPKIISCVFLIILPTKDKNNYSLSILSHEPILFCEFNAPLIVYHAMDSAKNFYDVNVVSEL